MKLRFSLRDLLWLTLVVAICVRLWSRLQRRRLINLVISNDGQRFYNLGNYPMPELVSSIPGGIVGWKS
jgi:hypothetical protein